MSFDAIEQLFDEAMIEYDPCKYDDKELGVYDFFNDVKYDVVLTVLNRLGHVLSGYALDDEDDLGIILLNDIEDFLFDKKFETSEKYFNTQRIHC